MSKFLWAALMTLLVAFASAARADAVGAAPYPPGYLATIELSCINGGLPPEACSCIVRRLDAEMPFAEYEAMNAARQAQRLHPSMTTLARITGDCRPPATQGLRAIPETGFTDFYVANFMGGCNEDGTEEIFCTCAVSALQRLLTFEEAIEYDMLSGWGREYEHPRNYDIMAAYFACADNTRSQRNTKIREAPKFQISTIPVAMTWPIM